MTDEQKALLEELASWDQALTESMRVISAVRRLIRKLTASAASSPVKTPR